VYSRCPQWKIKKPLKICNHFHCGCSITLHAILQITSKVSNQDRCKIACRVIMKWWTTQCCYSTMVNIKWFHCVALFEADNLKICFGKIRSLFKTSDKNLLAKKILLRQKRYMRFEGLLQHLGTLDSALQEQSHTVDFYTRSLDFYTRSLEDAIDSPIPVYTWQKAFPYYSNR